MIVPTGVVGSAVAFIHRERGFVSGNPPTTLQSWWWLATYSTPFCGKVEYVSPRQSLTQFRAPVYGSAANVPSNEAPAPNA